MVVACIALFVALGSGAYAVTLAKNSVTSKHVKNASLKGKDLKPDTLGGAQVDESDLGRVPSSANATNACTTPSNARRTARETANADKLASGRRALRLHRCCEQRLHGRPTCDPVNDGVPWNAPRRSLNLPHPGRVLLVAGGGQNSYPWTTAEGTCDFRSMACSRRRHRSARGSRRRRWTGRQHEQFAQNGFSITTVTAPLAAGSHSSPSCATSESGRSRCTTRRSPRSSPSSRGRHKLRAAGR